MKRFFLLGILFLAGCASPSTPVSTRTPAPSTSPTLARTETIVPFKEATPSPTPSPLPSPTWTPAPCNPLEETCQIDFSEGHFLLQSPIGAEGSAFYTLGYLYGTTANGTRDPHHDVDFENALGTSVYAAADGVVVFAGSDRKQPTYSPWSDFYGNHVVLAHHFEGIEGTVYTLYAHLSEMDVAEGEEIHAGEKIGEVGSTGVAVGSHLHFEVRLNGKTYADTRNPALWLIPPMRTGMLIGRVEDSLGRARHLFLNITALTESGEMSERVYLVETYAPEKYPVQSDARWQENFVLPNLPPGQYRIAFVRDGKVYERQVEISAGKISRILIQVLE